MKQSAALSLALVLSAASPALTHAQSSGMKGMEMKGGDMKGMDPKSMSKESKGQMTYKATGVVKKVDTAKGAVTVAHGPVKELKWSAMTMTFGVKDKSLLDKFAVDKKVEFDFVQQGKDYVVTGVK